jgi:hypothetical protein
MGNEGGDRLEHRQVTIYFLTVDEVDATFDGQ